MNKFGNNLTLISECMIAMEVYRNFRFYGATLSEIIDIEKRHGLTKHNFLSIPAKLTGKVFNNTWLKAEHTKLWTNTFIVNCCWILFFS